MAAFSKAERIFLDRLAWTMAKLNQGPAAAMQTVLGRDAAIAKFFRENAAARDHLARAVYRKVRRQR